MAIGPSGWTRTTTSRVKSPACCVDITEGSGANDGIRTRTSRLGRPVGDRYPTFALVRPTGIDPSRHAGNVECFLHTQAEHGPVLLTGPSTSSQFSKTPLLTSWWAARDSNPSAPLGENGFTARQRTIRSYRPFWRQRQDSNPEPRGLEARMLPLHHAVVVASHLHRFRDRTSPRPDAGFSAARPAKNKKGLLGDRPRRPGSQ